MLFLHLCCHLRRMHLLQGTHEKSKGPLQVKSRRKRGRLYSLFLQPYADYCNRRHLLRAAWRFKKEKWRALRWTQRLLLSTQEGPPITPSCNCTLTTAAAGTCYVWLCGWRALRWTQVYLLRVARRVAGTAVDTGAATLLLRVVLSAVPHAGAAAAIVGGASTSLSSSLPPLLVICVRQLASLQDSLATAHGIYCSLSSYLIQPFLVNSNGVFTSGAPCRMHCHTCPTAPSAYAIHTLSVSPRSYQQLSRASHGNTFTKSRYKFAVYTYLCSDALPSSQPGKISQCNHRACIMSSVNHIG